MVSLCCFCGKPLEGWGNDPYPANRDMYARCCDECNFNIVIPKRLALLDGKLPISDEGK